MKKRLISGLGLLCVGVMFLPVNGSRTTAAEPGWRDALDARNFPVIRALIESGVVPPAELDAAMREACAGHFDQKTIELLIARGARLNAITPDGGTLLHVAAVHHDLAAIKYLIKHGIDANRRNTNGFTALDQLAFPSSVYASGSGWKYPVVSSNAFELILKKTTDFTPSRPVDSVLHRAVLLPFSEPLRSLIARDCPLNQTNAAGETALMVAARFNMGENFKLLLDAGADPNVADTNGLTVLHDRILAGPDQFVTSRRTVWGVVSDLAPPVMKYIRKKYAPTLQTFTTNSYVGRLLKYGANPNIKTAAGQTPLHLLLSGKRHLSYSSASTFMPASAPAFMSSSATAFRIAPSVPLGTRTNASRYSTPMAGTDSVTNLVGQLIKAGEDVNTRDEGGSTPLHLLASTDRSRGNNGYYSDSEMTLTSNLVWLLTAAGADVNARDSQGRTPLLLAAARTPLTIPIWIKAGADVQVADKNGETALHVAVAGGHQPVVEALLNAGGDLFVRDRRGVAAFFGCYTDAGLHQLAIDAVKAVHPSLSEAVAKGRLDQLRWYLDVDRRFCDIRSIPEFINVSPLVLAIRHEQIEVVKTLLESGANPNIPDGVDGFNPGASFERPLADATRFANSKPDLSRELVEIVKQLLGSRFMPPRTEFAPLKEAAYVYALHKLDGQDDPTRALSIVNLLLDAGATLNPRGSKTVTPAQASILEGQPEFCRFLANHGQKANPYMAALDGDVTLLAKLSAQDDRWLKRAPTGFPRDPDKAGSLPENLLFRAAGKGHTEVVAFLLTNGVYAGPVKPLGETPCYAAFKNGHFETCKAMRIHLEDADIFSAIWCADDDWLDRLLVAHPELANQPTAFGLLPIHVAAIAGNVNALERLSGAGTDLNSTVKSVLPIDPAVKEIAFCTPLHLAIEQDHEDAVRWLIEHGARFNRSYSYIGPPLVKAVSHGNVPMAKYLLDRGAKPNLVYHYERRWHAPLDDADDLPPSETKQAMRQLLLEHGAMTFEKLVADGHIRIN